MVELLAGLGGCMTEEDLANHRTTFEDPICTEYRGQSVYEIAPNGQVLFHPSTTP